MTEYSFKEKRKEEKETLMRQKLFKKIVLIMDCFPFKLSPSIIQKKKKNIKHKSVSK